MDPCITVHVRTPELNVYHYIDVVYNSPWVQLNVIVTRNRRYLHLLFRGRLKVQRDNLSP